MSEISVIFLPVPPSLKEESSFPLDPAIPLPAELDPGETGFDPAKLSREKILSGMLRVIGAAGRANMAAFPPDFPTDASQRPAVQSGDIVAELEKAVIPAEWLDYYRRFVLNVKPEIYHEFTGASIVKAKNGEFDMALEISTILEGLFPGSPGVLLNKVLIMEKRAAALEKNGHNAEKENAEILEAYETALSLEPVLPDTLFNAGFFFMRTGEYKRAKDCFSLYIAEGEESDIPPEIFEKKKKQAKKIILTIQNQGLDDRSFMEAYDCVNRGNDEEGLLKIRGFIESHPKVWNGWFVLGWGLRKLGRFADALESFKKALELGGTGSELKNETAICLMELGDFKEARRQLEQALMETSNDVKIISNLGVLAMKTGNRDQAESYFRTVLELDPADEIARHFLNTN